MKKRQCACFVVALLFTFTCGTGSRTRDGESSAHRSIRWEEHFQYQYDYTLRETAGLDRAAEPVEITLSAASGEIEDWENEIRVLLVDSSGGTELVPFQVYGRVTAQTPSEENPPAESANIVFIASCPANRTVIYRLLWDRVDTRHLPQVDPRNRLAVSGESPGLTIENSYYSIVLSSQCGAIVSVRRAGHGDDRMISFYQNVPIHFVADVWSPPQRWDHDYDWAEPPSEELITGPLMVKYHRWGPMSLYQDVVVHLTYTFYAGVSYVKVDSSMRFTKDRSVHAVRLGEIVTTHSELPEREANREEPLTPIFTHYAWPEKGHVISREIDSILDVNHVARVGGYEPGAIAILDRDVPWIGAYHDEKDYGLASVRRSHIVMNEFGGPIPYTVPCTYVAHYGWGFSYWSRPEVYPFGPPKTLLDRDTVVSKGVLFANEEALVVFDPSDRLKEVREAHRQFTNPLKLQFKGTGPW